MVRAALIWLLAAPVAAEPFVHASLSADLTGDGHPELAVVVGERDLALAIWSENRETFAMEMLGHGDNIGWTQQFEDARLEVTEAGSLRLTMSNFGIGRNKWEQVLTIAWRNDAFRVAGFTHGGFDSLDPEGGEEHCDINLLTGQGVTNFLPGGETGEERAIRLDGPAPLIADWRPEMFSSLCGLDE